MNFTTPVRRPLGLMAAVVACASASLARPAEDLTVWPNAVSRANSDPWIMKNHDRIRQMRPRVLVLDFANGVPQSEARRRVDRLVSALKESSRFHGYADPKAPPFLTYQIARWVDLTDPIPTADRLDGNSTRYPRVANWKLGINFNYSRLFTPEFARHYGYPDPARPGAWLGLADLVKRGLVHEIWFVAFQGKLGSPYEAVEVKQAYDAAFRALPGQWKQAGNGGDPGQPFIGRSLRILFINVERGPGCAMESLGHAVEGTSNSGAIPYFTRYFTEYADFSLDRGYSLPFRSFYERGATDLDHPDPTTLAFTWSGVRRQLHGYIPVGGSVHFTPNGRRDYDMDNSQPVQTTIEHYRLFDGPDGRDQTILWTPSRFAAYRHLADDCMGPWLVYWRQNMPNYRCRSRDDSGRPMKNWWPFLFY